MKRFNRGEAITFSIRTYPLDVDGVEGALSNPDTYTITITNPNGSSYLPESAMTQDSTGKFYYNYPTSTSDTLGVYDVLFKVVSGTLETRERFQYELVR